jgi:hypothetical protein
MDSRLEARRRLGASEARGLDEAEAGPPTPGKGDSTMSMSCEAVGSS